MTGPAPVITGIGVVAPNGVGTEDFWAATLAGTSGIGAIERFDASSYPVRLAGEARGFVAADHLSSRLLPQSDRMTQMALAAAAWALEDAGIDPADADAFEMAVVLANAFGGDEFLQHELESLNGHGPRHVSAYMSFAWFYAASAGQISIRYGMRGPGRTFVSEQAGGLEALAEARRQLRDGSRLVVTGATDAPLSPLGFSAELAGGQLSTGEDPATAFQPFGVGARGHVLGEGGAIFTLESATGVAARGRSRVYGYVSGYGVTFDPRPGTGRAPGLRRAAELALADAGVPPSEIDVVFADAAGVRALDRVEAEALAALFGPYGVPVTAPKTLTGRLGAGGAALDVAAALLSIRDGVIPPTVGVTELAADCALDLVAGEPRRARVHNALVLARGRGGHNAALVIHGSPQPKEATWQP